jgi:hypothetical protein
MPAGVRDFGLAIASMLAIVACGPTAASESDGSTSTTGLETSATRSEASATATTDGDADADAETSVGATSGADDSTSMGDVTCEEVTLDVSGDPCPPGCVELDVHRVVTPLECAAEREYRCVGAGPPPALLPSAFYREDAGELLFAQVVPQRGGSCGDVVAPLGWTECTGAADDPPECACWCTGGLCHGEQFLEQLDGCGLPTPCGPIEISVFDERADVPPCVYEHLAARVPGVYRLAVATGYEFVDLRVYVDGDDDAFVVLQTLDDASRGCPLDLPRWQARHCKLAKPKFFEDCAAILDPAERWSCVWYEDWFSACDAVDAVACE